ncbi:hypothetical protein [Catenibacterium sp.]|uniref:hypothetical protein n=1 Tax=Catenibacterium sp. TaxID=2049022 RepID=UPI00399AA339
MSNNKLNEFSEDFVLDELESADSIDELPHNKKDEKELDERNKIYTQILDNYSKYLEETLNKNKVSKKYLINLMIIVLVLIIGAFIIISFIGNHLAIISAFISLVSAIIVIPTKIVEYLFNPQETQQISEIIKNIQNYDKAIRDDLSKEQK